MSEEGTATSTKELTPEGAKVVTVAEGAKATAAAPVEPTSLDYQSITYEDPATLPFELPGSLTDVTKEWMQGLLRYRKVIGEDVEVTEIEKKGVGMTAGYFSAIEKVKCTYSKDTGAISTFVVKAWPSFELLPKDSIKGMFIADMKGYSEFKSEDWYPRPDVFLASYDVDKDRWALVMADCSSYATHQVHENPLTLERVKKMIPALVNTAVKFEGCGDASHPLNKNCAHAPPIHAMMGSFKPQALQGAPLLDSFLSGDAFGCDDKSAFGFPLLSAWQKWSEDLDPNFNKLYCETYDAFWARADPENGATQTISHGDLRGDNLFWDEKKDQWLTIDFQLNFKGPIASDLAYLMTSGSVMPDVYENHTEEIVKEFYDLFMTKTEKYKDLKFEKFKEEYEMMTYTLYTYYVAMGAAIWMAATMDHDGGGGAFLAPPHGVGSGAIEYADLPPDQRRKRYWWNASFNNFRHSFKRSGQVELLNKLAKVECDFKAAFDYEKTPGCPWPVVDGKWGDVDAATAIAMSQGALTEDKAKEIGNDEGKISFAAWNKAVIPGFAQLLHKYPGGPPAKSE
jgi:hypothetical protein